MDKVTKIILFVSTTSRNDLCRVSAYINPEEQHDPSAKSGFHWQILKCRQIIFKFEELIATPAHDNIRRIDLILKKSFYGSGKLQAFLEKLKMPVIRVQELDAGIYESCLRYTIIAHIAPQWNQVQNYFLQGRKFLEAKEPLHAVQLEVDVKERSIYLTVTPFKVKVHSLTLEDLELPPALCHEFRSQMKRSIHDITIGAKWVHVLPSMKRGRIVTISHDIPNSCPYKTYQDLKRHWKNSYGYRLPESDAGIFYCTLSFHPMLPTLYTYPSICLKAAPLQFMGQLDGRRIMAAFLTDLAKKMPSACGSPFKINGELGYTIPQGMEQIKENIQPLAIPLELHTVGLTSPLANDPVCSTQNMARHSQLLTESAFASNASQSATTPGKNKNEIIESARGSATFVKQFNGPYLTLPFQNVNTHLPSSPQASPMTKSINQQEREHKKYTPAFSAPSTTCAARPTDTNSIVPKKYTPVFAPPAVPCSQKARKSKSATATKTSSGRPHLGTQSKSKIPNFGTQLISNSPQIPKVISSLDQAGSKNKLQKRTSSKVPASGTQKVNQLTQAHPIFPAFGTPMASSSPILTPTTTLAASGSQKRRARFQDTGMPSSGTKKSKARLQKER